MADQTAVDFRLHRQARQLIRRDRIDKIREGIFQHNGLFLPVFFEKFRPVEIQLIRHGKAPVRRETGAIMRDGPGGCFVVGQLPAKSLALQPFA
ncbi:hypothetical protein D3C85_1419530 [compost metagenome]